MKNNLCINQIAKLILLAAILLILSSCYAAIPLALEAGVRAIDAADKASKVKEKTAQKSQLAIREIQTRGFATRKTKTVMKTIGHVLMDDGFIVREANLDLGFITAAKEIDVQEKDAVFWGTFSGEAWKKNAVIEATANISAYGKKTRVRINFQQKVYDSNGLVAEVEQIEDPSFYQGFFTKVSKGLFIEQEKL